MKADADRKRSIFDVWQLATVARSIGVQFEVDTYDWQRLRVGSSAS
ncbi:hypothetical protein QF000_000784 [Paraburkholderia atlantica]